MELVPLMIALPLGMGFLLPVIAGRRRRAADVLANATTLALLLMAVALAGREGVYRVGGWQPPLQTFRIGSCR